jgi:hypothetical protein
VKCDGLLEKASCFEVLDVLGEETVRWYNKIWRQNIEKMLL